MKNLARLTSATVAVSLTLALTACGGQASSTSTSAAPEFPKAGPTIEWIVPSAAGGGNDVVARIVGPAMQENLGATVKVVNKEGGGQVLGLNYLANSKPDGLTVGATNIPSILGRYLDPSKKAGFDRSSFTPLGSFGSNALVVSVNKNSPHTEIESLFEAVKASPGTIKVGTDSRGGDDHINLAILEQKLGLDFNIVHYNSGADKVTALLGGEIDFALGGVASFYAQYKSGDIKVLSVIDDKPNPFTPEVPTLESAGYEVEPMNSNFAISVPANTPPTVVATLEAALQKAANDPAVQDKIRASGTQPIWVSGSELSELWEERETLIKPIIQEILAQK